MVQMYLYNVQSEINQYISYYSYLDSLFVYIYIYMAIASKWGNKEKCEEISTA